MMKSGGMDPSKLSTLKIDSVYTFLRLAGLDYTRVTNRN
jgi:hypothetical protein